MGVYESKLSNQEVCELFTFTLAVSCYRKFKTWGEALNPPPGSSNR